MSVLFRNAYVLSILPFLLLLYATQVNAQRYNTNVKATIKVNQTSEFATFKAIAENLTISDYSLSYEFMTFVTDATGNVTKSNQSDRFFIKQSEKIILASTTVNNSQQGKVVIVLFLYDVNNKPIGKDRVVVNNDGGNNLIITLDRLPKDATKKKHTDQASPSKDGLFIEGFVIQKTLTKVGRDFYKYFFSEYYNKDIKSGKNILIKEVPGRGRSTQIMILVDNTLVWQFFSRPDKTFLKQMASFALRKCISHLQNLVKQNSGITKY